MLSTPILLIVVFSFLFFVRSLADVTIDPELSETLASNDDPVEDPYNSILAFDTTEQANGKEPVDGLDSKQVTTSDSGDETSLENLISIKNCPPDQQGKIRKARQLEECPSAFTTKEKTGTQSSRGWPRGRPAVDPKKRPEQRPAAIEKPVPKEDPERCPKEIFKESRTPVCHDGVLKQAAKIAGSFHLRNAHLLETLGYCLTPEFGWCCQWVSPLSPEDMRSLNMARGWLVQAFNCWKLSEYAPD